MVWSMMDGGMMVRNGVWEAVNKWKLFDLNFLYFHFFCKVCNNVNKNNFSFNSFFPLYLSKLGTLNF